MRVWSNVFTSDDSGWRHHLYAVILLVGVQVWFWGRLIFDDGYLAHSDLYEYFLPVFLSPRTVWSVYEFAGFPAFADPQNTAWYPLHLIARAIGSWSFYVVSAYVVASLGAYGYVYHVTRRRLVAVAAGLAWAWCEALGEKYSHLSMLHAYAWLPVLLLCLERLAVRPGAVGIVFASLVIATTILTGHPQAVLYCLYITLAYGLLLGLAEKRTKFFFLALALSFVLGSLLTSVQSIPLLEASTQVARTEVGFTQFADSFSLTTTDLLTLFVPQVLHEGRETPTYVGALMVIGALLAWRWPGSRWRVVFWSVTAVVTFLLAFGSATPLASLAYHVPFYDKFRILARHLALFSFATIVLGSCGLAALTGGRWQTRRLLLPVGIIFCLGVAAVMTVFLDLKGLTNSGSDIVALPQLFRSAVTVQAVFWLLTLGGVLLVARASTPVKPCLLVCLLGLDLIHSQNVPVSRLGIEAPSIQPAMLTGPSVHTQWLKEMTDLGFTRVLPLEGSGRDPVAMGVFSRRWRIASAGGYGPLLPGRLARLVQMGTSGTVKPEVLLSRDRSLDLLAVRYLIVRDSVLETEQVFDHRGVHWINRTLDVSVGRRDCGYPYPATVPLGLPAGTRVRRFAFVGHLRCSEDVPQDTEVGTITIVGLDGQRYSYPLLAGVDISDAYHQVPEVTSRMRHGLATVFDQDGQGDGEGVATYLSSFALDTTIDADRLEVTSAAMHGWLVLDRITLTDRLSGDRPIGFPGAALDLPGRWREVRTFRTSRATDRGTDEDSPREDLFLVLENAHALPRAWMVNRVERLSEDDGLMAVRTSVLPDGKPFDPAVTAFVDEGTTVRTEFPSGETLVAVTAVTDGRLSARVGSEHGGFLVFSELWYPGWVADVDGVDVPVVRADYALMGVEVPPGLHRVTLRFKPWSLISGGAITATTFIVLTVVAMVGWRRSKR